MADEETTTETVDTTDAAADADTQEFDSASDFGSAVSMRASDDTPLADADDVDADDTGEQPDDTIPGDNEGNDLLIAIAKQQLGLTDEDVEKLSGMNGLEALLASQMQGGEQAQQAEPAQQQASTPAAFTFPWEQEGQSLENSDWDEDTAGVLTQMRDHYEAQQSHRDTILQAVLDHLTGQQAQASEGAMAQQLDAVVERAGLQGAATPAVKQAMLKKYRDLEPVLSQQGLTGEAAMEFVVALTAKGIDGIKTSARQQALSEVKQKMQARQGGKALNPGNRTKPKPDPRQAVLDRMNRLNPNGARY